MTYRQLSRWLANGYGEILVSPCIISTTLEYHERYSDEPVGKHILIRPWDRDTWTPACDVESPRLTEREADYAGFI